MKLRRVHHVALIVSDLERAKRFYVDALGLTVAAEHHRVERDSWKVDLALPDGTQLEVFTFPGSPPRPTRPEAQGLRHLAFAVDDVAAAHAELAARGYEPEPLRVDEYTGRMFCFVADPDGQPIELYAEA